MYCTYVDVMWWSFFFVTFFLVTQRIPWVLTFFCCCDLMFHFPWKMKKQKLFFLKVHSSITWQKEQHVFYPGIVYHICFTWKWHPEFWAKCSDLSRGHFKWWWKARESPPNPLKFRFRNYGNLPTPRITGNPAKKRVLDVYIQTTSDLRSHDSLRAVCRFSAFGPLQLGGMYPYCPTEGALKALQNHADGILAWKLEFPDPILTGSFKRQDMYLEDGQKLVRIGRITCWIDWKIPKIPWWMDGWMSQVLGTKTIPMVANDLVNGMILQVKDSRKKHGKHIKRKTMNEDVSKKTFLLNMVEISVCK